MDDVDGMDDDDNNDNDDDLDDDVGPLVVCNGVSVRAFNEYVGDGEGLRIGVRFLQLEADGRLLIVEFPLRVHEATADHFKFAFVQAFGNVDEIGTGGSFTARRAGLPRKEADATFGPTRSTPNRTLVPPNLTFEDWITLAVEIGRSQSWARLLVAARFWHGYPGIQYILLLKIGRQAKRLRYALFDVLHPLVPGQGLPAPVAEGTIYRRNVGVQTPENIQFDGRRILSIPLVPQGLALPPNVNDPIVVDLRDVMTMAMLSIGRQ